MGENSSLLSQQAVLSKRLALATFIALLFFDSKLLYIIPRSAIYSIYFVFLIWFIAKFPLRYPKQEFKYYVFPITVMLLYYFFLNITMPEEFDMHIFHSFFRITVIIIFSMALRSLDNLDIYLLSLTRWVGILCGWCLLIYVTINIGLPLPKFKPILEGMREIYFHFPFGFFKGSHAFFGFQITRMYSFWTEPSAFASFLMPFLIFSYYIYKTTLLTKDLLIFSLIAFALFLTFSDAAHVTLVISVGLSYFILQFRRLWFFAPILLLFCLSFSYFSVVLLLKLKGSIIGSMVGTSNYDAYRILTGGVSGGIGEFEMSAKWNYLVWLVSKCLEYPLGYGNINEIYEYANLTRINFEIMHWVLRTGIIGFTLLIFIYLKCGFIMWKCSQQKTIFYISMAFICVMLIQINSGTGPVSLFNALLFIFLLRHNAFSPVFSKKLKYY